MRRTFRLDRGNAISMVVLIGMATIVFAAVLAAEGYRTPRMDLHDAGVWITDQGKSVVGRTNTQIQQVDTKLKVDGGTQELLQSDAVVLVHQGGANGALVGIDGRTAKPNAPVALPANAVVGLAPPSTAPDPGAAVLDGDGNVWTGTSDQVLALKFGKDGARPAGKVEGAQLLVVGSDDIAHVYSPGSGQITNFDVTGRDRGATSVADKREGHHLSLSAVGATPVVLDATEQQLLIPGRAPVDLRAAGGNPVLQEVGPSASGVLVATDAALVRVPLDGGAPQKLVDGTPGPARPVSLRGCAYGAWSAQPLYSQICDGFGPRSVPLPKLLPGKQLQFRTNRNKVVINELEDGAAYILTDGDPQFVDWSQAITEDLIKPDPNGTPKQRDDNAPDPEEKPPTANPDTYGTRPDRAIVVHPQSNDTDPNQDVLVVDQVEQVPEGARVDIVDGGDAVQITPPSGSLTTFTFTYWINDGRGGRANSTITVEIHSMDHDLPPVLKPNPQETYVVAGSSVTHNVLTSATDPDGDTVALVTPVHLDSSKGTLTSDPNGVIVYTPPGTGFLGDVEIHFTVTDDYPQPMTTDGVLLVHVLPNDHSNLPKVRGDHATAVVGHEIVVDVLANDSDADGDPLRVIAATQPDGTTVTVDAANKIHFTAAHAMALPAIVMYSVTDGPHVAQGPLRVDVIEQPVQQPPVAVRDDVELRATVPAVVDVLQNDYDPNGDVLVVQSVAVSDSTGLVVEIIDHRFLRITPAAGGLLRQTTSFTYTITDGNGQSVGIVVVRPGPTFSEDQPPHAVDDDVSVRAGNIGAFDVLANDSDPEGGRLTIVPPTNDELAALGLQDRVFAQGDLLRFIAPTTPGTFKVPYSAKDPGNNTAAAYVVVHVLAADLANNGPKPPDLTARTVAGKPVQIQIPVATMDPDGDPVALLGVADTAPAHGAITEVGLDHLTYVPDKYDGGFYGTEQFTYRVRDSLGAEATATIRVGVAPPVSVNSPPVAVDDVRQVNAGGTLSVDVVHNDSDPDNDPLSLDTVAGLGVPQNAPYSAEIQDGRVVFHAGSLKDGEQGAVTYTVTDGILTATGVLKVTVAKQENLPPIALDDLDVAHPAGQNVTFDVLKNDSDPDGVSGDLHITEVTGLDGASATSGGQRVTFTMPNHDVELVYTVADAQGATARAVLRVPLAGDTRLRPVANYDFQSTSQNTPVTIDVLANDTSSPGTHKTLLGVDSRPPGGTCAADGGKVTFTPATDFVGTSGCTYVLGDGPGDAPETLRSVGMVGVEVRRNGNTPPTFVTQPLRITANEQKKFDLLPAVTDPDDGDLQHISFSDLKGQTDVLSASFEGTTLTLDAKANAPDNTVVELTFTVSDGHPGPQGAGKVEVTLSKFQGALAVLVPDTAETFQDVQKVIPVLANDQRGANNQALKIVDVSTPVGGTVAHTDTDVTFTPAAGFHGATTFTYTVDDGTNQLERQVSSTVTVTVIGRPDRPPAPAVVRESGAITLTWGVPAANGAPITSYSVKVTGGSVTGASTRSTSSNTFRFDGLKNGDSYTFQIAAINAAVDEALKDGKLSEPEYSPPSEPIIPNAIPPVPAAPTAKFEPTGNAITVTWTNPGGDGTPVTRYVLQTSPPPNGAAPEQSFPASGSTMTQTIGNLTNGVPYTFRVKAINQLSATEEGDSGFSPASAPEVPASRPDAPAQPQVSDEGDQNITVTWTEPKTNGDAIRSYDVEVSKSGSVAGITHIADPGVHQAVITTDNGSAYTFRVRAENKAGFSDYSAPSAQATSYGKPFAVTSVSANVDVVSSGQAQVSFGAAPDNGDPVTNYEYRYAAGGGGFGAWTSSGSASSPIIVSGLSNSTSYAFEIRGCNRRGCSDQDGPQSNAVVPYGAPSTPSVSGGNNGGNIDWNWTASSGNGRNILGYDIHVDAGGVSRVPASQLSYSQSFPTDGSTHTLYVVAVSDGADGNRNHSATGQASVTRPAPSIHVHRGNAVSASDCPDSTQCSYLLIDWSNFSGGVHSYTCNTVNGGQFWPTKGTVSGPSGVSGANFQLQCYADPSPYGGVYVVMDGVTSDTANW